MAIGHQVPDQSRLFNSVYKITRDMSGWDKSTVQVVAPIVGSIYVYGSNDGDAVQGVQQGDASLAINFNNIQATNLATGVATNVISAAGSYSVPINNQFVRLQGSPAGAGSSVYKLLIFDSKVG